MRTPQTCNTCTQINKQENGKHIITTLPDSECQIRESCPDDGSTTTKRKETLHNIPS